MQNRYGFYERVAKARKRMNRRRKRYYFLKLEQAILVTMALAIILLITWILSTQVEWGWSVVKAQTLTEVYAAEPAIAVQQPLFSDEASQVALRPTLPPDTTGGALETEMPQLRQIRPEYAGLTITDADKLLLAQMAFCEASIDSFDGQVAAVEATLNRAISCGFPDTISGVLYQKGADGEFQYRSAPLLETSEPGEDQFAAVERALYGPSVLPGPNESGDLVVFFSRGAFNDAVAYESNYHVFCYQW